ncbi:FlhB domain-containing protein [Denitrovibrio acetiphilus DSM 12809]|uniref:FlhB domain-containing protein n=1 Tax=Denitrovibrio acetiphilus (strain DSM 12809 / NBRC 114555 / N2460) TaxID=522772 RepID=D4H5W8_DENA2|nr:EscU/YscU/HrcU family type III secretion system export apparatus switch protein [Denitrovibrio acetiphilus]ADD69559.1 FlhB domain-containing protein [Denitrovibrio acetiphilus DSM 12809]
MKFTRKKAAAIRYDKDIDKVPKLVAKGQGLIADKIIAKAKEHDVHITEDKDLVEALSTLDLYEEIPEELYKVVAYLLAELYKINGKLKNS